MNTQIVIHRDKDILGGIPVFVGTRVPVKTLFDYLVAGEDLEEFLDDFPTVSREQALAVLESHSEIFDEPGDLRALIATLSPAQRILRWMHSHQFAIKQRREQLQEQYPEISEEELNLKIIESFEDN